MPTLLTIPNRYRFPIIRITVKGKAYKLLVDTGASVTVLHPDLAREAVSYTITKGGFNGSSGPATSLVGSINFNFVGKAINEVHITPEPFNGLNIDGLIGQDLLSQFKSVEFFNDRICFKV